MNKLAINRLTVNSIHVNNINVNALQKGLLTGSDSGHVDPTRPVIWNPEIQFSNPADSYVFQIWNGSTWEDLVIGQSYAGQSLFRLIVNTTGMDEVSAAVYNSSYMRLDTEATSEHQYVFEGNLNDVTPQQFTVTVDIFIRFEDIQQAYPLFFEFTDEHNNLVSWGNKVRVGSTITRTKGVAYANLLEDLYTITNPRLNGVPLASAKHIVETSMVFTCTATWTFDNNEPKSILSPRLLRIPNSSYKILSHIPDISGHGNHGKINNSAYAGMSGANGYPVVFGANKTWGQMPTYNSIYTVDSNKWHITKILHANRGLIFSYVKRNDQLYDITEIPSFKIKVSGLEGNSKLTYSYIGTEDAVYQSILELDNGTYELPESLIPTDSMVNNSWIGFTVTPSDIGVTEFDCDITIEVLPDYEGAYCLDGVNDFVTIPTGGIKFAETTYLTNAVNAKTCRH